VSFAEYANHDGLGLAQLVCKGEVTPLELLEASIERIEKHNPQLNAVIYRMDETAREAARGDLPDGPFRGVPFLIKDILIEYAGTPTTSGSRALKDMVSRIDSELMARYKRAGLVTVGKTNTPELGIPPITEPLFYGPTRNPWNTAHTPGGSSGGAAAAVASGMVPIAHGNDIGGSIRVPASCCGLVGMKPTRARNPLGPIYGDLASGMVSEHVLTRTVRDSAAVLDATAGPDLGDPYWAPPPQGRFLDAVGRDPGRLRIAFATVDSRGEPLHDDNIEAVKKTASLCESLGHAVEENRPQLKFDLLSEAFKTLFKTNIAHALSAYARYYGTQPTEEGYEPLTLAIYRAGLQITGADYLDAVTMIQMGSREVARFFQAYDAFIVTTMPVPPPLLGAVDVRSTDLEAQFDNMTALAANTAMLNATGQPGISLPLHVNGRGLPIGVQFAGRFGDEEKLYSLASQLEEAAPWFDRHPPLWG
jgi:amidase